jgi:ligand-binding sensor protein
MYASVQIEPHGNSILVPKIPHRFCRLYKVANENHKKRREAFDKAMAVQFMRGEWTEPKLYRCRNQL